MTVDEFKSLIEDRGIYDVREVLFALVNAWFPRRRVRLVVWPDSPWRVWVEYDDHCDLSGHAACQGTRGEGADAESAIRDCAVRWFKFIHKDTDAREERVAVMCEQLGRAYKRRETR